jgi:lysozyme family protein
MVAKNFPRSLEKIFGHEGGYSNDRADPGNWTGGRVGSGKLLGTKFGIAANSYPKLDIKNLTLAEAATIYRKDYATKVRFDDLPSGLDHAMLDFAINSGPRRANEFLQRCLGVPDDGILGPITMAEVGNSDTVELIKGLCASRLALLKRLRTWPRYKNGWTRRVKEVEAFALELAGEPA